MPEPLFPGPNLIVEKPVPDRVILREDIKPIKSHIVDVAEGDERLESVGERMEEDEGRIHWVDFEGGDLGMLEADGFKHAGPESFLISPIDGRDWFSDHYFNCTAVVAIGRDVATGKEISFLSHQDPRYFVDGGDEKAETFSRALRESLEELKAQSAEQTVEVLLLGGNFSTTAEDSEQLQHHYKKSIERLRHIVQDTLGFDPKVLAGPNNRIGTETVVTVETQKRKVWIERDKQPAEFDQPFQANMLDEMEKKWKEGSANR